VISHRRSCGQSAALFTGLGAPRGMDRDARRGRAERPGGPADAARGAHATGRPANLQLLTGYRRARRDRWLKRVSSRIANGCRSRMLGDATPDTAAA
jgi:dolichol-phosphate mannosyltransferase